MAPSAEDGSISGAFIPPTVTEPPVVEVEMLPNDELMNSAPEMVRALKPDLMASKVNTTRLPDPEAPVELLSSVSAVPDTTPWVLSLVPGMKKVEPPFDRKEPSDDETADSTLGLNDRSN